VSSKYLPFCDDDEGDCCAADLFFKCMFRAWSKSSMLEEEL